MAKMTAKKLAKMSEEERAYYLEQQRLAEEEAQRKKEEMLNRFLKDKLAKEETASKLNRVKLQEQWRNIMRKTKCKELTADAEVMKETFERVVDRKDAIIKSLAKDLEEAEEQYQVSLRNHLENVDELLAFQHQRINDLEKGFQGDLDDLKSEFDRERESIISNHDKEMHDLKDVMYAMELRFNERENEAQSDFQGLVDELKNKNLEETHALNAQRKSVLDDLWEEFEKETQRYKENTEDKKLRFEALKKKDEANSKEIAKQMKRLKRLQEAITSHKAKISSNTKETETQMHAIRQDRETVLAHFHELKTEMMKCREKERANLTTLTLQSSSAMEELQRQKDKGEKILRLAEMCRKLETEEEKVLPFFSGSLTEEEDIQVSSLQAEVPSDTLAQVMLEYSAMEQFWKRYNKVLLDELALQKKKQTLEAENQKLKFLLKQYLDGISVNQEILNQSNPLMVVSSAKKPSQLSIPLRDPRVMQRSTSPNITVVEAAHIAKHVV